MVPLLINLFTRTIQLCIRYFLYLSVFSKHWGLVMTFSWYWWLEKTWLYKIGYCMISYWMLHINAFYNFVAVPRVGALVCNACLIFAIKQVNKKGFILIIKIKLKLHLICFIDIGLYYVWQIYVIINIKQILKWFQSGFFPVFYCFKWIM